MTPDEETKKWIIKTAKEELKRADAAKVLGDEEERAVAVSRASKLTSSLRRKTRDSGRVSQLGIHDEPKPEE